MARMTQRRKIHRFALDGTGSEHSVRFKEDVLAAEEPLEIRIAGTSFAVTMRTPGDDFDLVAGFLVSEGIIRNQSELISLRFCAGEKDGTNTFNVVDAQLRPDVPLPDTKRHVYTSSSCGICGTDSIDAVRKTIHYDVSLDRLQVPVDLLAGLPERLREAQAVSTGQAACTLPGSSGWMVPNRNSCACVRTSAATTPWTRWWVGRSDRT
ncbi:Sulfur carrier protein FdhD [Paenarthrobacter nitroguajacolicus]|nr:Sulfur carrier protein FdhD [Paenarthrobacter nitroguajacolicus]